MVYGLDLTLIAPVVWLEPCLSFAAASCRLLEAASSGYWQLPACKGIPVIGFVLTIFMHQMKQEKKKTREETEVYSHTKGKHWFLESTWTHPVLRVLGGE
jgi:hypothetical protein